MAATGQSLSRCTTVYEKCMNNCIHKARFLAPVCLIKSQLGIPWVWRSGRNRADSYTSFPEAQAQGTERNRKEETRYSGYPQLVISPKVNIVIWFNLEQSA